ncbi:MAG TPA: Hsp20/alpha crystallin family protein [Actinospica sp.]|jgi:HSP20 family molecular chaperone IbpA|nr:Hsp20/alpha crystallin family protein [Actinospica sp.]
MAEITHRSTPTIPFLGDLFDLFPSIFPSGQSPQAAQAIRIEAHFEPDAFVLRAELPGIDPAHDVEVSVSEDVLTLRAERTEVQKEKHHSEFRYGSFSRALRLPPDAKAEEITATYAAGILTVNVPLSKPPKKSARTIEVKSTEKAEQGK